MSRMHAEIHRLAQRLHSHRELADESGSVRADQADDLLACLYGLYALLCLHFVSGGGELLRAGATFLNPAETP